VLGSGNEFTAKSFILVCGDTCLCVCMIIVALWANVNHFILVYLTHSAKLPEGLYILLALISSFYLFIYFIFTMSKAISVSTGAIFTICSPNGRYLNDFS